MNSRGLTPGRQYVRHTVARLHRESEPVYIFDIQELQNRIKETQTAKNWKTTIF